MESRASPKNSNPAASAQVGRQGEYRLRSMFSVSKKTVLTLEDKKYFGTQTCAYPKPRVPVIRVENIGVANFCEGKQKSLKGVLANHHRNLKIVNNATIMIITRYS